MSGTSNVKDVIYWYDGTYEGFLCCVFESYQNHEIPYDIWPTFRPETSFFPQVEVGTDPEKARRVDVSIQRMGWRVRHMVMYGFLNDSDGKEIKLLRFLRKCYGEGAAAADELGNSTVAAVVDLEKQVANESCRYKEFVRFEEREGMLGAVICPQHYVLPLLREHFCDRLPEEDFVIFDNTHCIALVKRQNKIEYVDFQTPIHLPTPESREALYQKLWKAFFKALTIEQRRNEKLQQSHCPKKYWEYMLEMR